MFSVTLNDDLTSFLLSFFLFFFKFSLHCTFN